MVTLRTGIRTDNSKSRSTWKRMMSVYVNVKHFLAKIHSITLLCTAAQVVEMGVLTWGLEVPQLGGGIVNFKDPITGGSFSPAVNGHELPVFKSFHGMIKKPEGEPEHVVLYVV